MDISKKDKILQVAAYFIKKSQEDPSKRLDPLKLQKLIYYSQAWNLALSNGKLFPDNFQAWIHGPANLKVWYEYKTFNFGVPHPEFLKLNTNLTEAEKSLLESIWHVYGKFDGKYLETLTHNEEPWLAARKDILPNQASQNIISDSIMKEYYGQRLKEAQQSTKNN